MTDAKVTITTPSNSWLVSCSPWAARCATKDRVRKRIVYALVKGKLRHAAEGQEGLDMLMGEAAP